MSAYLTLELQVISNELDIASNICVSTAEEISGECACTVSNRPA